MWQEMRKHEKKLRGMIVDYKKRSERRKEYYERIKRDPAEFLQIWGRPAKIHLDPAIATAAESTLTAWRDDETTMIDRFDVRSHLDIIDEYALKHQQNQQASETTMSEAEQNDERLCNYERYRVLIHNESTGVSEEQCLRDIEFDEKFGALRDDHHPAAREAKKKKSTTKKAEIGFVYDDAPISTSSKKLSTAAAAAAADDSDDEDDDDDDLDIEIDINQLTSENKASLNKVATHYGMAFGDFARMLILDREEMQTIRDNKLEREQDIPVKGRRARRERRLAKERRIKERDFCPPNYLNREMPKLPVVQAKSKSRSPSPVDTTPVKEKIEFITAFGDDDASKLNDLKRKRPFEKSLLDECREAKKKADPTVIPVRTRRLVTPPPLPSPTTTSLVPCRSFQRKSQVLLSTLQKLKDDGSPERRVLSDDEIPAIKIVRLDKKEDKEESSNNDDEEEEEDDDLQQYLKRKEARQRNQNSTTPQTSHKEQNGPNQSTTPKISAVKTPQEKLRRRMQTLLKKQFQKDKDQQREREEREEKEREVRESELRQSSAKLRHRHSRHRSSSRSRSRSRSRSPTSRRRYRRSSSRSSSSTSSTSSSSSSSSSSPSHRSSKNRTRKRPSPVKSRSPTPEFLRQRFRRSHHRRDSSSSSSSSRSNRSSSRKKRTDYK
ncbi:unnamed protein product [Adineta steineri]|uniref:Suppressor of white apricot N-terminal domain-containing protein n=1 Tax=Adineta steineri TaxID=433720 RepID=A0A815EJS6_9BILA|nr:unnamed protein product [Adineta steineri]CAF1580446.1 unnamed protein product [Adineta steineri]